MRPIRTFAILPTMFTLGNLVCGFFAIVIASRVQTPILRKALRKPWRPTRATACSVHG